MTNDQTEQIELIRQILIKIRELVKCPHDKYADNCDFCKRTSLCNQALNLLSCSRCGGIAGEHKQVNDPQAGNSHMLTKMSCPLDK